MNRKKRKLLFIRSKNKMFAKGYKLPKWKLVNHRWPTKWENLMPSLLEENWIVDMEA